jgi:phosphoglycolate phosphatase-like HAD superfamily hydrolase
LKSSRLINDCRSLMPQPPHWIVLFDIDGTLVLTGRAGLRGMNAAFSRLYGSTEALDGIPVAGRTDRAIVSDALRAAGLAVTDDEILRLREAYIADLQVEIGRKVPDFSGVLPGVEALLAELEGQPSVSVGLLTGNFQAGARIKLGHFDLWDRFPYGAFGDDHDDRNALVPIALARARETGVAAPAADRVVVIGDTPLDVACAHAHGARAVAVATGSYSSDQLRAAGADVVVETLEEARALLANFA